MTMENEDAEMLDYTFSVITTPFLLPELVERVANMFNYLFSQMVVPHTALNKKLSPSRTLKNMNSNQSNC